MKQNLTLRKDTSIYTINDIYNEVQECTELLSAIGYKSVKLNKYTIKLSARKVRNLGMCSCISDKNYVLSFNAHFIKLAKPESVHNCIMHEVLHSLPNCMNHKAPWKKAAAEVNANYIYTTIKRLNYDKSYNEKYVTSRNNNKYQIICNSCKRSWYYKRRSPVVQTAHLGKCTCPYCKSRSFTVITL